jgi:hypothetical protein
VELANASQYLVYLSAVNPQEFMPKVEAAARKALELDHSLAQAHSALGNYRRATWDWDDADREYKRAVALNANLTAAQRARRHGIAGIYGNPGIVESVSYRI